MAGKIGEKYDRRRVWQNKTIFDYWMYNLSRIENTFCIIEKHNKRDMPVGMSLFMSLFLCQKILRCIYLKEPDNHSKTQYVKKYQ